MLTNIPQKIQKADRFKPVEIIDHFSGILSFLKIEEFIELSFYHGLVVAQGFNW